jgi:internalin A
VPTVERIWLDNTGVTDDGLKLLRVCPELRFLTLNGTAITDRGVAELAAHHPDLDTLSLNNTKITDAALADLARLSKLKHLWLRGTAITDARFRRLQAAMPECEIQADVSAYSQKYQNLHW